MSVVRTIEHPGVSWTEEDLSLTSTNFQMTTALIVGFSDKGEELSPSVVTKLSSYETMFGKPTTEAEAYAYYAVKNLLAEQANVYFAKLPYDNIAHSNYRALGFTIHDTNTMLSGSSAVSGLLELEPSASFVKRILVDDHTELITADELDSLRTANNFTEVSPYTTKSFAIVNKIRDTLTGANADEGTFVVVVPAYNAIAYQNLATFETASAPYQGWAIMQGAITPVSGTVLSGDSWVTEPDAAYTSDSISKDLSRQFPIFQYPAGNIDHTYLNQLVVLVMKSFVDTNNGNLLNYELVEKWVGTLGRNDTDPATGKSIFLGDLINSNSQYIEFYMNSAHDSYALVKESNAVYSMLQGTHSPTDFATEVLWEMMSFAASETLKKILVTDILTGVDTVFENMRNIDEYRLDIVVDAGLSNIAQYIRNRAGSGTTSYEYDPTTWDITKDVITSRYDIEYWQTICQKLTDFCQQTRKDCMAILDAPRAIALEGNEKIIRSTRPNNTIDANILPKLRYMMGINSNYAAEYVTWCKVIDDESGNPRWLPNSCKAAAQYAYTDANYNFFEAPYGFDRGRLSGVVDISFNPDGKQEDQIYLKNFNYVKSFPRDGFILMGQKTLQAAPSAFDRVNVRRLFLKMERLTYDLARYFVGRINNSFTRTQLLNTTDPKFANIKRLGGMYDYRLICDETNNTADVIENNELKISILMKPSIVADYILAKFTAVRTGGSFEEVII